MTTSPLPALQEYVDLHGLDANQVRGWFTSPGAAWFDYECGRLSAKEVLLRLGAQAEDSGLHIDVEEFVTLFIEAPRVRPDMLDLVSRLRNHVKVACVTNTVKRHGTPYLFGLEPELFDVVLASCELGVRKPAAEAFLLTCRALSKPPEDCAFLDDDPANVEAAQNLGLRAFVVGEDVTGSVALHLGKVGLWPLP